jgi:hypothetical protein
MRKIIILAAILSAAAPLHQDAAALPLPSGQIGKIGSHSIKAGYVRHRRVSRAVSRRRSSFGASSLAKMFGGFGQGGNGFAGGVPAGSGFDMNALKSLGSSGLPFGDMSFLRGLQGDN